MPSEESVTPDERKDITTSTESKFDERIQEAKDQGSPLAVAAYEAAKAAATKDREGAFNHGSPKESPR